MPPNKTQALLDFYHGLSLPQYPVVVELGVQYGGSLALWQSLWPKAFVVGVDINPDSVWPTGTIRVLADQTDPLLPGLINFNYYDLVIDDASHLSKNSEVTFNRLWSKVSYGGIYVIEDWNVWVSNPTFYGQPDSVLSTIASCISGTPGHMEVYSDYIAIWKE